MVLAPDGRLLRANPATAALVPQAAPGQPFHDALHHVRPDGTPCPGGCLLSGTPVAERAEVVGQYLDRDGVLVPFEATAAPLQSGGASVVGLRDVSARVAADEDRRVLLAAAQQRDAGYRLADRRATRLPGVEGVSFDLASRAMTGRAASGSDVIDVSLLPDGRVLLLVVDSLDHRAVSADEAWQVLFVARAFLQTGVPLPEVVHRSAITLAAQPDPPSASVLIAAVDPRSGQMTVAVGGHPPPLVVRRQGVAEWLAATGGGVGASDPGSRTTATAQLLPGDRLVLYTDGVVDGSQDLVEGLSALSSAAVARRSLPMAGWANGLLDATLGPGPVQDDATMLAVSYQGAPTAPL